MVVVTCITIYLYDLSLSPRFVDDDDDDIVHINAGDHDAATEVQTRICALTKL